LSDLELAPPKVQWNAAVQPRDPAIREMFRAWRSSPEELIASGDGSNFDLQGEYHELCPFSWR